MDSSLEGAGVDSLKCSKMSIDEKRQLVYELSKQSHLASELLQTWSRQEILQILCAEMGKERKYTGLTKVKIIETLLKIVSEKSSGDHEQKTDSSPSQRNFKRQRKADNPSRHVVQTSNALGSCSSVNTLGENAIYCNNLACRAILRQEDKFCRRCSCCICHKYDDNKDPSLWLTCSSDPPFPDDSCSLSCHLECAFNHEKSGLGKDKRSTALDGCFYCVSCGKTNGLLECWKKQLTIAMETRRVDVLCYRLFLGQKLLKGTKKYQKLFEIVDKAVKNLEEEVGPLTGHPMKMGRGIVNRLHSGPEVQKLCSSALKSLEKTLSDVALHSSQGSKTQVYADTATTGSTKVRFEDVRATSLTVVLGANKSSSSPANIVHYSIWHRKVTEKDYPAKSTCTLFTPNTRFVVSGLAPASEYCFKVVPFSGTRELHTEEINISTRTAEEEAVNCSSVVERSESPLTNCSSLSTPSSVEAESNNDYISYCLKTEEKNNVPQNLSNNSDSPSTEDNTVKRVSMEPNSEVIQIDRSNPSDKQMVLKEVVPDNRSDTPVPIAADLVSNRNTSETSLPITPFRSDQIKNRHQGRTGKSKGDNNPGHIENASTSKQKGDATNGEHSANGGSDSSFEQCVKIIRQLECSGHIEKSFRQKFLTWYSLRAMPQEIRVVKIFIDTFMDDPSALAEQLVDTFTDCVSSKRCAIGGASAVVPAGFCMKLWH